MSFSWKRAFTALGALAVFGLVLSSSARAASDEQNLVDRARITIDDLQRDKEFGTGKDLLHRAKGVLVVPSLIKGGFFVGGEGGTGVLLVRQGVHNWSYPAFYTMASASFGLQIGGEQAEVVLFALTDKGLHAFMSDEFKLGAQAGLAVVTLGSSAQAATTSNLNADIVVWASASGAYAGITVEGSVIKPRDSYNQAYYGRALSPMNITLQNAARNPGAESLRRALGAHS